MAVLPAKNTGNGKQHASGARFRQRKISVKQPLTIYRQKDLPTLDSSNELEPSQVHHLNANGQQQRDIHAIETGVDKNEEDEVHLQQVINAAQKALLGSKESENVKVNVPDKAVYIPTPDASKVWADAKRYYNDQVFKEPESYIKFSATVEDTVGVEFNMDEEDENFLQELNKKKEKCTEVEFEIICDKLEKTIDERQPFLSMDTSTILSYKELYTYIIEEFKNSNNSNAYSQSGQNLKYLSTTSLKEKLAKELKYDEFETLFDKNPEDIANKARPVPKLFELFGESIYGHWKDRKIVRKGKAIHPILKFEDPSANEKENDNDPYICFRRREFRQARKTRRADTLGVERIRLLQKSMHRARELFLSISQRELLKLEQWETEHEIFKLRSQGKNLKRAVGIKGDDYLFYSHKRKKVIKTREEEAELRKKFEKKKIDAPQAAVSKDKLVTPQEATTSSTQPYVKLPPSKIPDMDLVTVSLVLKEKNETIKRAVLEKLRKRKEQDKGFVNVTDDPYQPYFNISTNGTTKELSHIPYSSIAAANFHQISTTNFMSESLKRLLEDDKKPLPGMKSFRGSNGELIPSKAFPHLLTLLQDKINNNKYNSVGYIAQLLSNIETHNFSAYNTGYGHQQREEDEGKLSDPIFRLRKRAGRSGRTFIDRRGLITRPNDVIDEFLTFDDDEDAMDIDSTPNVYDSKYDTINRLDSRWRFDYDLSESQQGELDPFSLDPSRLNCISDDTQSIRFGSMLLSKSYGLLRESVHLKQQLFIQQAKMRALQQQSLASKQQQQQQAQHTQQVPTTAQKFTANKNPTNSTIQRSIIQRSSTALSPNFRGSPVLLQPASNISSVTGIGSLVNKGELAAKQKSVQNGSSPLTSSQMAALKSERLQYANNGPNSSHGSIGSPQLYNSPNSRLTPNSINDAKN